MGTREKTRNLLCGPMRHQRIPSRWCRIHHRYRKRPHQSA
nr:MAG TPA: hypothetical protein [Caudoviricetes sp.]